MPPSSVSLSAIPAGPMASLKPRSKRGGWYVLPLDIDALFRMNPQGMYEELLRRALVPRIEARASGAPLAAPVHAN